MPKSVANPFQGGYKPEMDVSPESDAATYFQWQIGILRWLCEIGRIGILVNVPMLALVSEFEQCDAERRCIFCVVKKRAGFGFSGRGQNRSHDG